MCELSMTYWRRLLSALLLSFPLLTAQTMAVADTPSATAGNMSVGIGLGRYSSPLFGGNDLPIYLLPRWSYYHDRFYIEDLDLGFNLLETSSFSWDITTKQSFDGLLFRQDEMQDSLLAGISASNLLIVLPTNTSLSSMLHPSDRHLSYLGGSSIFWRFGEWQFKSALHGDISNVHHGSEWNNELRYLAQVSKLEIATTLGARWLDSDYSNYYFGLGKADTRKIALNSPGAQWLPSLKLELSWSIAVDLRVIGSWRREWLADEFKKSYLFDTNTQDIWFIGVMKTW
ncbi:MipA/OmpV family protein [Shewanella sp. KJ2020]|uniref:MipA/OmpV family protein n=1 Tax=Shewanella sp. KJ2020 TaxID=2919172 RepID=UPI0020A71FBE|nr:MipA/OmpV family protein [Shewanella sp. KJ2020]MCP3128269.1 MipA/OmpV family protein [Shewanella sp. KJ2020]